jgi:hypothetical protein
MTTLRVTTLSNLDGTYTATSDALISGSAKAWVNFNGMGVVEIRVQHNVFSITDNGTGDYSINLTNSLTDENFSFLMCTGGSSNSYRWRTVEDLPDPRKPNYIRVYTVPFDFVGNLDAAVISAIFFR